MKRFLLAIILIVCALPAFADDCETKYKIRTATVLGETIYRVERWETDGVYYSATDTNDLEWARYLRDLEIASCRAEIQMKEREKAMEAAKWVEVK